jgi:autotransporter translocation and assembly factor TamB
MASSLRKRRTVLIVVVIVIATALLFAYANLLKIQNALLLAARDPIERALEEALGVNVEIGSIAGKTLSEVIISDLSVFTKSSADSPVLSANHVEISYSLLDVMTKRKNITQAVTGMLLIEPRLTIVLPSDSRFPPDKAGYDLGQAVDALGEFGGSVSVKDGRCEVVGIPGLGRPFVVSGITGGVTFTKSGAAGRVHLFTGDEKRTRIAVTGGYHLSTGAITCDVGLSGSLSNGLLRDVRNVMDEVFPQPVGAEEETVASIRQVLNTIDTVNLEGGTVDIEAHVRPGPQKGIRIRGKASIAEAELSAPSITPGGVLADVGQFSDIAGSLNLALDFQLDDAGLACQGKSSVNIRNVQWLDNRFGFGEVLAKGKAAVEFWKNSEDEFLSFEGSTALDTPHLSVGEALKSAAGLHDSVVKVEGPARMDLAFAGRSDRDVETYGTLKMDKGVVTAGNILPEVKEVSGDMEASLTFRSLGGTLTGYEGKVRLISGRADAAFPAQGIEFAQGNLTGAVSFSGEEALGVRYKGVLNVRDADVALDHRLQPVGSSHEGRPYGEIRLSKGTVHGRVEFQGESPGTFKFDGMLNLTDGVTEVSGTTEIAELQISEMGARGDILFRGELPGKAEYGAKISLTGGAAGIRGGLPWLRQAGGQVSGKVDVVGDSEGGLMYSGDLSVVQVIIEASDAPGGIKDFSGEGSLDVSFRGGGDSALKYEGTGHIERGNLTAVEIAGGIRRLEGPVTGTVDFKGKYKEEPAVDGVISTSGCAIEIGEIEGFVRSLTGDAQGEIHFLAHGAKLAGYSGEATIRRGAFVADEAFPGLLEARGLADVDLRFSSPGDGYLAYDGKAKIHSGSISTEKIYPGLQNLDGNVTSEFSFRSSDEGVRYEGFANLASGRVMLKDGIEGFDYLDGDITANLKFQGVGREAGAFEGDAVISGGTLKAGQILKGIESIEGAARLEATFSGGAGIAPAYDGTLIVSDASFSASDVLDGVKSIVGKAKSTIEFASQPEGPFLFKGTADILNVSFAAGQVYPGIKELGGNGAAQLVFERARAGDVSYSGKVVVTKGILSLEAISARLDNIAAEVDFDQESLDIRGMTGNFGKSGFEARGLLHFGQKPKIDIRVKSNHLAFEELGEITVAGAPLNVSGDATLDVGFKGFYPDLDLSGQVSLSGVEIEHAKLQSPASNVEGIVKLLGNGISSDRLTMIFSDSPVEVKGSVTDLANPYFDINAFFGDIQLSRAKEMFDLDIAGDIQGRGKVSVNLTGSLDELWTEGDFELSDVSFEVWGKSLEAGEARGKFRYGNNGITLSDAAILTMGGEIGADGVVLLKKAEDGPDVNPWTWLSLDIRGILAKEAASYFAWEDIVTSGVLDAKVVLEAEKGFYSVQGLCSIESGNVKSYSFDNAKAEFRAENGKVIIDELTSEGPNGHLTARGVVHDNADFEIQVAAKGLNLQKLGESFDYHEITGTGNFVGTVSGKDKALSIDGLAELLNPVMYGIRLDSAAGRVSFKDNTIRLSNILMALGDAAGQIAGVIELGREYPGLDLLATITGLPVADLVSTLGMSEIPLGGQLSGKVAVRGTTKNPEAEGEARLSSGEISGIKLDDATTGFTYAGDTMNVENLSIGIGAIRITASGNVTRDGRLNLDVDAQDFDLSKLPVELGNNPIKRGSAGFSGRITGEVNKAQAEGRIVATSVQVMDAILPDVTCDLELGDGEVRVRRAVIHDGTGQVTVEGNISLDKGNPMNLTLTVDELDAKTALGIARPGKKDPIDGRISGKVVAKGDLSHPALELQLNTRHLSVGGIPLESASLDAGIFGDRVDVRLLQLFQAGDGYFEANGSLGTGEPISLVASARNFDISALSAVLGWKYPFTGNADLAVKAEGELQDPSVTLSLRIANGSVDRIGFDLLAARMTFSEGVIIIEDGEILQGRHRATVYGRAPIPKESLEAIGITAYASGEELDVNLTMTNAKLELISAFYKEVEWAEGNTDIDLHVAGTIASPRLYGSAVVNDGTVKLFPITDVFRNIDGQVKFEGTQARIERFSCRLGDGKVNVSGAVALLEQQEGLGLDLKLTTQDALVNTGMFRSLVNSDIKVYGPVSHPLISGRIRLVKAIMSPDTWSFEGGVSFDADLALTIDTEGDLRLRTKIMDIPASGSLKIGGTFKQPQLSGRMEARRGWFAYFGNEFTVRQASAEFAEKQGIMPRIEVEAETSSGQARIFIGLRGVLPDDLALELSSSPPLTRDEILALLNYPGAVTKILGGDVEGAFKEEITKIFEQELRLQVSGGIGRVFEDLLALDEFRLQRGTSNQLTLKVGKYLIDSLYLSYEKPLGPESYGLLRFDYFYRPGVIFTGTFDEKGEKVFGIEARLRF